LCYGVDEHKGGTDLIGMGFDHDVDDIYASINSLEVEAIFSDMFNKTQNYHNLHAIHGGIM